MKTNAIKSLFLLLLGSIFLFSCTDGTSAPGEAHEDEHAHEGETAEEVHLSQQQFDALGLKTDTLPRRNMSAYVEANGQLGLFPQNEAGITASVAGNIARIQVIEGQKVSKGQALAYLQHPDLLKLQMDYADRWNRLPFLEQEYLRQKELYEQKISSGREMQEAESAYRAVQAELKGYEAQLRLLGISPEAVRNSEFSERIAIRTPISGYVRRVFVKTGQYVQPEMPLFEVVNNDRIHVDLMVFEKDMYKVKKGQKVKFFVEVLPDEELEAEIYAVGKAFEQDPKALHLHAEIQNKKGLLIPGTYVRARIITDDVSTYALPEAALVREGDKYFFFTAEKSGGEEAEWHFRPVEVIPGIRSDGWVEVRPMEPLPENMKVALNKAYYLLAEMKKGEVEHDH
ncbi:MAG TPA: efflux RND transporter periplasmic adaptor subunit [Phaeodactylibacter sp.]|nr:efflux RND transporter periplasmic adaptor subunit [Phaeodactylibacter sp.]